MKSDSSYGLDVLTLSAPDGSVRASVAPELGAAVSSLVFHGREILFQQPFFWDRHNELTRGGFPFLFPVCGRLERNGRSGVYLYERRLYEMKIHGFAMRTPWRVVEQAGPSELLVDLEDTEETLAQYPFSFRVTLRFKVGVGLFQIEQEYRNTGDRPMPYYAGFHPYFLTPGPGQGKEGVQVDLKPLARILYNATLTDVVGEQPPPRFPAAVSEPGINEMLARLGHDKAAHLVFPDGDTVHLEAMGAGEADLFPYLQLYTMADKPFFCVEPWMGFPNALNAVAGCRWLQPGQTERGVVKVWVSRATGGR